MSGFVSIGKGSSKNLFVNSEFPGHVFFEFSDRVSVFDYGALPDEISEKGRSLERAARVFFKWFEENGLATAYQSALSQQTGRCALRAARHPKFPQASSGETSLEFIPLEVIFRWGVVPGSSLLKRDSTLKAYDKFSDVRVEYSTKLESMDRMLDLDEARELAGSHDLFQALEIYAVRAATLLRDKLKAAGLDLWDGKIECAWDKSRKEIVLVDAITPDELRVTLPGLESAPLSKELLRHWLGGTDWAFDVRLAKKNAAGADTWRDTLAKPPRLGSWRRQKLSELYKGFATSLEKNSSMPLIDWARRDSNSPSVYITGTGGREAALKWRLKKEGCLIAAIPEEADVIWVSPDGDLAAGLVDEFQKQGLWTYGPRASSALIESSKRFGKKIALEAQIPMARYSEDPAELKSFAEPPVVKFDGLAAGKGVVVADSWNEAEAAVAKWSAKGPVVLEERMRGFEASAFYAVETGYNGTFVRFLGSAKDFKRRFQSDEGPNTGGMGAHSPHPALRAEDLVEFRKWADATARVMAEQGLAYNGVLYIGALKDKKRGWSLLEYNARLGDPETEALVCTWSESTVLRSMLKLDIRQDFRDVEAEAHALCVALVTKDYPESSKAVNLPPWEIEYSNDCVLFKNASGSGRVAFIVGRGKTLFEAGDQAFGHLLESPWKGLLDWRADLIP